MELDQLSGPLCIAAIEARSPQNNSSQVAEATAYSQFITVKGYLVDDVREDLSTSFDSPT
jgi:hypothetical protein